MNNDRLLELAIESGAVITINTDGKLWAITLTSIDQLRTLYELVRKEVVPEGCPSYAEIYVGQGKFAICDWTDFDYVKAYNWRLTTKNSSGCVYAQAWDSENIVGRKRISMHNIVLPVKDGFVPDHINGNGLDNRRSNLRYATKQQNGFNQKMRGGSSEYKGVSLEKKTGLWRSYITHSGRRKYLGRYGNEIDAAKAYDMAASRLFGDFANLNFPSMLAASKK